MMTVRLQSPAFQALRPSAKRLLTFVESVIEQDGGGSVVIHNDMFEKAVGSRRVYTYGLCELAALGLLEVERQPKRHVCALSDRWKQVGSFGDAALIAARARTQRQPPPPMRRQAASVRA